MMLFELTAKPQTALLLAGLAFTVTATSAHAQMNDTIRHYSNLNARVQQSDDTILELFDFVDGFAWTTENKENISDMLSTRIETLEARINGINVTFPPVTELAKQGPPVRIYSDKWKPPTDAPKRMKKKACKAGDWDKAGYDQGAYGRPLEDQLARATKKCLKHKIPLDTQAYTNGHQRGLGEYCSYERGLFVTAREITNAKSCYDKGFASFETGIRHGQEKLPYYAVRNDIYRDAYLIRGLHRSLAKARRGIPTGTAEPSIYTRHEYIIDEESARSQYDIEQVEAFQEENPLVLTAPKSWKYIRADKDLDYPLPE